MPFDVMGLALMFAAAAFVMAAAIPVAHVSDARADDDADSVKIHR